MNENVVIDASISLDHIGHIYKLMSKVKNFENIRIKSIALLPGGLTNDNFFVTATNDFTYAVRCAGPGTAEFLDRPAEKNNAKLMADLGINCEVFYYDDVTGDQVCKYVDNNKIMHLEDFANYDYLKMAADIFKKYHNSGLEFKHVFEPIKEIAVYDKILKDNNSDFYEGLEQVEKQLDEIVKIYDANPPKLVPCHNDPLAENFLVNEDGMTLIDWEYGGAGDALFDVGDYIIEMHMDEEHEEFFLKEYFGREATDKERAFIFFNKVFCDVMWAMWAVAQIVNGKPHDEYWPYGEERWIRALGMLEKDFDKYIEIARG